MLNEKQLANVLLLRLAVVDIRLGNGLKSVFGRFHFERVLLFKSFLALSLVLT